LNGSASRLSVYGARIYLVPRLHAYPRTTSAWDHLPSCVPPLLPASRLVGSLPKEQPLSTRDLGWARTRWYWNINQLCIDYAFRPRLSSRLTLGGLAFPRNPWSFGGEVFHPSFATHTGIRTRTRSTTVHTAASRPVRRSPTTPDLRQKSAASALGLSPVTLSAQDHSTSELLRTLSRVAASKPTSWLSVQSHIVFHLA
jgi:hypothetical protein